MNPLEHLGRPEARVTKPRAPGPASKREHKQSTPFSLLVGERCVERDTSTISPEPGPPSLGWRRRMEGECGARGLALWWWCGRRTALFPASNTECAKVTAGREQRRAKPRRAGNESPRTRRVRGRAVAAESGLARRTLTRSKRETGLLDLTATRQSAHSLCKRVIKVLS